jgi:hypothetical protein
MMCRPHLPLIDHREPIMKRFACIPVVAIFLALPFASLSASAPDRPAGVPAANWVPVSERLGIVLMSGESPVQSDARAPADDRFSPAPAPGQALLLKPPVGGYFMVKGASGWTRLVVIEPVKGPADVG